MPDESHSVPVWVELVTHVTVPDPPPPADADVLADMEYAKVLAVAVAERFPGIDIVNVLLPEQVEQVMSQHAADLQEAITEIRRLLNITIGAADNGINDLGATVTSLRNIVALMPRPEKREVPK